VDGSLGMKNGNDSRIFGRLIGKSSAVFKFRSLGPTSLPLPDHLVPYERGFGRAAALSTS
jgi:hypothetical protein